MNMRLNTRNWSTPLIMGSGLFVSGSGVLMFLGIHNPLQAAHEWVGLIFAAGILLHVLNHWPSLKRYFSQKLAIGIMTSILIVSGALVYASTTQPGGGLVMSVIHAIESAPLAEVAPLLDEDVAGLVAQLESEGLVVKDFGESLSDIADANQTDGKRLLNILFEGN